MGYESKIYIVEKRNWQNESGKTYARIIAMFDLCKYYPLSDVLRYKPKTSCFFYADDCNTEVTKDMYGEDLTETTVQTVINVLNKMVEKGEDYRRIFPLLSTLNTIDEQQKNGDWGEIVVLHYGY